MVRITLLTATVLLGSGPAFAGAGDLFEEKVKDFGTSARGTVLVHYFRFTNSTNDTLRLGQPRVSCGCTSASLSKAEVAPGETGVVIAQMDTRRIPTPNVTKSVIVYVPFLSPTLEEVSLKVQTVCRDDLLVSPSTIALGSVKKGAGGKGTTRVTFTSDPNWEITEAKCTGGYLKIAPKVESRNGSTVTYAVTATLDSDCPAGNWMSEVFLKTSNPEVPSIRIPVTVNVTESGTVIPVAGKETRR